MSVDSTSDPRTLLTSYVVLRREDEDGHQIGDMLKWAVVGRVEARTADAAIRDIATHLIEGSAGMFVATPERSWKPVQVKAETRTVLTLEQPT